MMPTATPSIFANPDFWRGAARARAEMLSRHHDRRYLDGAIAGHETIIEALERGTEIGRIPEYQAWLGEARR